jgi:hypothetical protein
MKIILFGLRRSGTTLAFNLFRQCEELRCYYEPLHPQLIPSCLQNDKKRVYSEYRLLGDDLFRLHQGFGAPEFDVTEELIPDSLTERHLSYLDFLFQSSEDVLIQPVRVVYQLRQLRQRYPDAQFVWVIRQPAGFIHSVLTYRSDLLTWRDAGLASNREIRAQKKNLLLRAVKGRKAFENPWSQVAAANFIVQNRSVFQGLEESPAWIKLMALWYDHYRHVTEFIQGNPANCHLLGYENACASEDHMKKLFASLQLAGSAKGLAGLIDANVIDRQRASMQDLSAGEKLIQDKFAAAGVPLDLSYRHWIG